VGRPRREGGRERLRVGRAKGREGEDNAGLKVWGKRDRGRAEIEGGREGGKRRGGREGRMGEEGGDREGGGRGGVGGQS